MKMSFNTLGGTAFPSPASGGLEGWQRAVRRAGHRLTRPRRAVLEVVAQADAALTAAEIHRLARDRHPHTGLVTVYRTLNLLVELGLVRRLRIEEGGQVYLRADLHQPGHHLICRSCHRAVEFPCRGLEEVVEEMERRTGFTVQDHWLELFGLCPACQEEQEQ
ncbi:MAG TPA: transcriptional repressor [Anaerolineales bacterium]|nr:transcriptional repressor [Anaerolineales bacterium]